MAEQKYLYSFQTNIESTYDNNIAPAEKYHVGYTKIRLLEYGFQVVPITPDNKLEIEVYEHSQTLLKVKIKQPNTKYYIDLNNKRVKTTQFGYNDIGSEIYILSLHGKPFVPGQKNPVIIYSLDQMDLFDKAYWWGREDNQLKGFLNEIYKSAFYLFIPESYLVKNEQLNLNYRYN